MLVVGKKDGIVHMMWTDNMEKVTAFSEAMDTTEYMPAKSGIKPKVVIYDDIMSDS